MIQYTAVICISAPPDAKAWPPSWIDAPSKSAPLRRALQYRLVSMLLVSFLLNTPSMLVSASKQPSPYQCHMRRLGAAV